MFNATFGAEGTAATFFGGQWYLVGLLLLIIFVIFLMAYRANREAIATVIVLGLTSVSVFQLFFINEQIIQSVLLIIFIFVGFIAFLFFGR